MKTSIVNLFPARFGAADIPVRRFVPATIPRLRILRPVERENIFHYATKANNSRWEALVFGGLAASALAALGVAFAALV